MKSCVLLILIFCGSLTYGQLKNEIFTDSTIYSKYNTKKLGLEFSPFFKNNEYFKGSQDGQTYIGYQLQGVAMLKISPKALLHLGALATQNYGTQNGFSQVRPIASILYFHKTSTFIAGTLKGAAHHQLIEPLYQMERFYTNRNENGFQYLLKTKKISLDAWLDWEINTNRNINRQEAFVAGFNLSSFLFERGTANNISNTPTKQHQLKPNLQFVYRHQGPSNGASNDPLKTLINSAIGIDYEFKKNGVTKWRALSYFLDYRDLSISPSLGFLNGWGHFHTLQYSPNKKWDIMLNYWEGTEWHSAIGGAIYQANNPLDNRFPERKKQLLFARIHHHFYLDDKLMIDVRFDPHYDFTFNLFAPSYALHIRYVGLFL